MLASPAFFKEDLLKVLPKEMHAKITLATCNHVGKPGINEVLKRPELAKVLQDEVTSSEMKLVEELLGHIGKQDHCATYGLQQTKQASKQGAIEKLILTTKAIQESRLNQTYKEIEYLMKTVEATKGIVHIISADHEGGKRLNGLGGIGAILRYPLTEF